MRAPRPIRRAQLINPFGIGSMVDFPGDVALMPAGLDAWPSADMQCPHDWLVNEERLQRRLGVSHFRQPPEWLEPRAGVANAGKSVPFVRFPRYCYCTRCGLMRMQNIFGSRIKCDSDDPAGCGRLPEHRRRYLIPVRIVAVCGNGHLQDFPFYEWVHGRGSTPTEEHRLKYVAGGSSAALSGISIRCSCGLSRNLGNAFSFDAQKGGSLAESLGLGCSGDRPWLAEVGGTPGACGEHLRVVQRGASNVYFPTIYSSIYLPLWAEQTDSRIIKALEDPKIWGVLTSGLLSGREIDPVRCEAIAAVRSIDAVELRAAAQRKYDGIIDTVPDTEEEYRRHEYDAFREGRGGEPSDLSVYRVPGSEYAESMVSAIREIGLVKRLRETRVLAGFTRLLPAGGPLDRLRRQPLSRSLGDKWLPAIVVRGEGIFVDFAPAAIAEWLRNSGVEKHLETLLKADRARQLERSLDSRVVSPKFILLHSFAHALIRRLANDCGYGSASLRERIYCDGSVDSEPMQGVLIYTASGDSEGTMGGLVRQGEPSRLEYTIQRALHDARWCSADPICYESTGQGTDNGNLAACHGCLLLPETSCEEGNRLLDRQVLVGRPDNGALGFFSRFGA